MKWKTQALTPGSQFWKNNHIYFEERDVYTQRGDGVQIANMVFIVNKAQQLTAIWEGENPTIYYFVAVWASFPQSILSQKSNNNQVAVEVEFQLQYYPFRAQK